VRSIPAVEDVVDNLDAIASLKEGKEYFELNEQVGDMMAAFTAPRGRRDAGGGQAPVRGGSVFEALGKSFQPDAAAGVDVVFQYNISGDGGGDWYTAIKTRPAPSRRAACQAPPAP
jgi:hypothetical protein